MRVRLPILGTSDGTRIRQMARLAAHLKTLMQTRLLTWLVIMVVALPVVSTGAVAEFEDRDMASMQMSMDCDHGDAVELASPPSNHMSRQDQHPCCASCDMPDCATGTSVPALTILVTATLDAPFPALASHAIDGDRSQISVELSTPRKPPRV